MLEENLRRKLPFQCIRKFNSTFCTVPAQELFQYALKIQNENKISVQSSIYYNPNKFRNQNFNPPALLTTSPEMTEIILSYLTAQFIHRV